MAVHGFVCLIWMVCVTFSFLKLFTLKRAQKGDAVESYDENSVESSVFVLVF